MRLAVRTGLPSLERDLAGVGLALRQAVPRDADHLLLVLDDADGATVAGQWFADPARAAAVADATGSPGLVHRPLPTVVVQAGGADRRLPGLRPLVARPGHELLAHRPERRAVVRHDSPAGQVYTKVVRPGRVAALAATLDRARAAGTSSPTVLDVDERAGTLTTATLPGVPLYDAWGGSVRDDPWRTGLHLGQCVREIHRAPTRGLDVHDAASELATTRRWLELARGHGVLPLPDAVVDSLLSEAAVRLAGTMPPVPATVHRDLHDKQLLLDGDRVGVLDLDTLALGDPALDLANLQVHLELRVHQGRADPLTSATLGEAVLEGYGADAVTPDALSGYALTTRLRLCAVYAFRPASREAALPLLLQPALRSS